MVLSVLLPSFHPAALLSFQSVIGIGSLVFSEPQHGARGVCGVVRDRAGFFGKFFFAPKIGFFEFIGKFSH